MQRDSVAHTFNIALLLCVICSVLVSGAAVSLRGRQQANKERLRKSNILAVAGFDEEAQRDGVEAVFDRRVTERVIDLETGEFVTNINPATFDQKAAARDPDASDPVAPEDDVARVRRRERDSLVYLVKDDTGATTRVVLPIRGYGLWSTLWGFVALDAQSLRQGASDIEICGLTYYEHGETPGLGGEVDNPRWKAKWTQGKHVYNADWRVLLHVIKGPVDPQDPQANYKVDGLSGATLTSNGVTNMLAYWFSQHGFEPFLQKIHQQPELLDSKGGGDGG